MYPESVNIDYQKVLFSSLDDWFKKINEQLSQAQIPLDFLSSISTLSYLSANFGADAINELAGFFKQEAITNDGYWMKMVKIGTNTDLAPAEVNYAPGDSVIIGDTTGIDVYRSEPWLREMQTTWVQENTQLIKSIPKQHLDDVTKITQQAVDEGWRIDTGAPFITVNMLEGTEPGLPQRRQVDDSTEEITEDRLVVIRIQSYGKGAFIILQRLRAWFGSSPGMIALRKINVTCPSIDFPKDVSAAVSTGFEERALMNATLSYADVYRIEQETIAEVPITVITDNPPSQADFIVIIPE
jgi:hypothetical protein